MSNTAEKTSATEKPAPDKRRALGRGLDSLLPGPRAVAPPTAIANATPAALAEKPLPHSIGDEVREIDLALIDDNPHQTRYHFDQKLIQELAESISANGVVQPIVVRPSRDGRFTLVLGERRCRASK